MGTDPVKSRLNIISAAAIDAFKQNASNANYDFTAAAKTMVREAYDFGLAVGTGKEEIPAVEPTKDEDEAGV